MDRSTPSRIAMVLLAAAGLGASAGANALTSVHISVGVPAAPVVHVPAQPVHVPAPVHVHVPVHDSHGGHAHHGQYGHYQERAMRSACRAPRWHPHVRYMPGQVVRRQGELWVARPISARVWNENSPPEWTPKYWAPAVCR